MLIEKPPTWIPIEPSGSLIPWWLKTTTEPPRSIKRGPAPHSRPLIPRIIHPQPETINVLIEPLPLSYKTIEDNNNNNLIVDEYGGRNEPKISVKKLYEKALMALCHLLPKIFKNITTEGCLDGGKKAVR